VKKNPKNLSGREIWESKVSSLDWDKKLAELKGHPLQSALWGDAKTRSGGASDLRLMYKSDDKVMCMARIEHRRIPGLGRVAWIPKGPVFASDAPIQQIHIALKSELSRRGFIASLMTPYKEIDVAKDFKYKTSSYHTIVTDLEQSADNVWERFPAKLRSQIRSAQRKGVTIELTTDNDWIEKFYDLCIEVSGTKGFELPGSFNLMLELLLGSKQEINSPVTAELIIAKHQNDISAGYFFIRSGDSLHNIWSAYNRNLGVSGASDLIVWEAIKRSIEYGCKKYDQEGIDKEKNITTYLFKKKFGGSEMEIPGLHAYPLSLRGEIAIGVGRFLRKFV
jgi:peptidoglycan pentaglycine glycine transferase (the first glycine)